MRKEPECDKCCHVDQVHDAEIFAGLTGVPHRQRGEALEAHLLERGRDGRVGWHRDDVVFEAAQFGQLDRNKSRENATVAFFFFWHWPTHRQRSEREEMR